MKRSARILSTIVALVCFVAAAWGSWVGFHRLCEALGVEEKGGSALSAAIRLENIRRRRPMSSRDPNARYVILIGDSMMMRWTRAKSTLTVPKKLSERLQSRDRPIHVVPFTLAGLGVDEVYALVDRVAELGPDLVIIEFNLKQLAGIVRREWRREKLVGFIEPHRLPQALTLDLFGNELTVDELLFRVAMVQLGGTPMWAKVTKAQGRMEDAYRSVSRSLDKKYGSQRIAGYRLLRGFRETAKRTSTKSRPSAEIVRRVYGPALRGAGPGHPVMRTLSATVSDFRAEGPEVLVFSNPANVEHFDRLGLVDPGGLERTIESLRQVVENAGGRFADYHDLLPDEGFRDSSGHLSTTGRPDAHTRLGSKLADEVRISLGETPRAR